MARQQSKTSPRGKAVVPPQGSQVWNANPSDFGRKTTPVRERLARQVREMPPEERLKRGR